MATILLKRGLASALEGLEIAEGEVVIAYDTEDKNSAKLYIGGAGGEKILVTADVAAAVKTALDDAKEYTDTKVDERITALINGAPATLDTLQEIAAAIETNQGVVDAIKSSITNKVDKEDGKQLSEENYTEAEKTKLSGIADGANNYVHPKTHEPEIIAEDETHRFVTDAEKEEWSAKLGADDTIDGGTF